MSRIVVGLDPGSGVSSPTGIAAFEVDGAKRILFADTAGSKHKEARERYQEIGAKISWLMQSFDSEQQVSAFCESFVMRGKGGEVLARLTGVLMNATPKAYPFGFVSNTRMKLMIGGHGHADKTQVAAGVLKFFSGTKTEPIIKALISEGSWDILDALGIGIAGAREHGII